jgi:hypothetical protein
MYAVPVKCETHGGFGEMQGMLRFDGRTLLLQYQTSDSVLGVLRSQPRQVVIALDTLMDLRFRAGWFWLFPHLEMRLSDFEALAQLPEAKDGRVQLSVRFSDRDDARRLAAAVSSAVSEYRYALLSREIDEMTRGHPLGDARVAGRVTTPPPPPKIEQSQ